MPVYVCWVASRGADGHAALLQEATPPSFHGSNAPHERAASRSAGALQMAQVDTTGFVSEQAGPRADRVATAPAAPRRARPPLRLAVPPGPGLLAVRELLAGTGIP